MEDFKLIDEGEGEGVAAAVLQKLGMDLETIRIEVEKLVQPGPQTQVLGDIPFNQIQFLSIIYRNPENGSSDSFTVPVRPGSIVVTPATRQGVYGHCFADAFAMLLAVPCFGGSSNLIED